MLNGLRLKVDDIVNNDFTGNEFKNTVARGSMIFILSQGINAGLNIINAMVLARLLTPSDFGVIGMVTVFVNFFLMFKDAGLSTATIQNDKISLEQVSNLFWINVIISLSLGIILIFSSPFVSAFYNKPELTNVMIVLSFSFIIQGLSIQHSALLKRHLKFAALSFSEIFSHIASIIVAISMALLGFRYWSLVGGIIARTFIQLIMIYYFCSWIPAKMQRNTGVRIMLKFGGQLTLSNFARYFSSNMDRLLIGRFIGDVSLGLYTRAFTLFMQPLSQIRGAMVNLSLPVLSSLKYDEERFKAYFKKLLDISFTLTLPLSVYCFMESKFLVSVLLGQEWMDAEPVFKVFAITGFFIVNSSLPGLIMISNGYSKRYLNLNIVMSLLICISFIIGLPYGILGVAIAYTLASILIFFPFLYFGFKGTQIKVQLVFKSLIGPLISVFIAGFLGYLFIVCTNGQILDHIIGGIIIFTIYIFITFMRSETRNTFKALLRGIYKKD